jgi:hypothetical protein
MKYFILTLFIFSFGACQNQSKKEKIDSLQINAVYYPIKDSLFLKSDEKSQQNKIIWDTLINFKEPVLIDSNRLNKICLYKKEAIPSDFMIDFKRFFCNIYNHSITSCLKGNLDDEPDNERIICFSEPCPQGPFNFKLLTFILKKKENNWCAQALIIKRTWHESDLETKLFEKEKIIVCKSDGKGSGNWQFYHHFYKYINEKYQLVLNLPVNSHYSITGNMELSSTHKGVYYFINPHHIKLVYHFDLFRGVEGKELFAFKGKLINLDLKWNTQTQKFELENQAKWGKIEKFYFIDYIGLYKAELIYLSQYGSADQKEALKYFRIEMEKEKRKE